MAETYTVVSVILGQSVSMFDHTSLQNAKNKARALADQFLGQQHDFHVFVADKVNLDNHHLDLYTRAGRMKGVGPGPA